ncbi:MAG: Mu transposase C-terminal domain-containing protein [Ruminococcus sp.]|nr:Mu transposase C-terminal domain-containing protein [Ruminococcus sp.]
MDYLSTKEVAELKGCSDRYIKQLCKDGKIQAKQVLNCKGRMKYLIPISELSEDLQAKYYAKLKSDAGLALELKDDKTALKQSSKSVKKAFDEYSQAEREEMAEWIRILREWQELRANYKKKTDFDADFVGKCRIEHPDLNISVDILYRKYAAYKENDYDGLIDRRGGWNRGTSSIRTEVWHIYASLYLSYQNPKISKCYRETVAWCVTNYPEFVDGIPDVSAFRRRTKKELDGAVASWVRDGEKKCLAKFGIFAERDYSDLEANDVWIFDNHTLDIRSIAPDGRIHRMSLTAIQDAKSGVIVGYNPCDNPCSQSTLFAMYRAVSGDFGLCRYAYLDNGSEFCATDVGGRGHRKKSSWCKEDAPPTIFELLGIQSQFALPANPDAKNIERFFYTFKEQFSKSTGGFCGGTVVERHSCMNEKEKNHDLPTDAEVIELLDLYIKNYNAGEYGGKEAKYRGKRRIDVWNESVNSDHVKFRDVASEEDLTLLLARSTRYQQIKRDGVFVIMYGKKIWFRDDNTIFNIGKKVYVRFDPYNLDSVRVYEKETDKYLWTYPRAAYLDVPYLAAESEDGKDRVAEFQKNFAKTRNAIKEKTESYTNSPYAVDSLAAAINEMKLTVANYEVKKPKHFEPVTAQEIDIEFPKRENIVDVDYSGLEELEELRAMNDRLERARKGA